MKNKILILFLFAAPVAYGQTSLFSAGITYCNGAPAHNPGNTGSRYAIDTVTYNLYIRRHTNAWGLIGNNWIQNISGCSAPAYTPTKYNPKLAINTCDPKELYAWDGAAWDKIAPSTAGISGTGLATRIAAWTASGALGYDVSMVLDTINNRMGVNTQAPVRTLHVTGEARISDLTTDTPTRLVGADADGDLGEMAIGAGLSISGGILNTAAGTITGAGLLPRIPVWNSATNIGYESSIRIDTTNNALLFGTIGSNGAISGVRPLIDITSGVNRYSVSPQYSFGPVAEITNGTVNAYIGFIAGTTFYTGTQTGHEYVLRVGNANALTINTSRGVEIPIAEFIRFEANANTPSAFNIYNAGNTRNGLYSSGRFRIFTSADGNSTQGISFGKVSTSDGTTYTEQAVLFENTGNFTLGHSVLGTARLDVNSSGTTNASDAANFANSNDSTILRVRSDRRVGINTAYPRVALDAGALVNTDGIAFPSGTTAQRPAVDDVIRTDTDVDGVEVRYRGDWYRITSDVTPTIAAGAGLGSGSSVSCVGNDLGGTITFTTGSTAVAGALFTATFAGAFSSGNVITVTFSARNAAAAAEISEMYISAESTTSFTLTSWSALTDETEYKINYKIGQ